MPALLFSQMKKQDSVELFFLKSSDRFYNTDKMFTQYDLLIKSTGIYEKQRVLRSVLPLALNFLSHFLQVFLF